MLQVQQVLEATQELLVRLMDHRETQEPLELEDHQADLLVNQDQQETLEQQACQEPQGAPGTATEDQQDPLDQWVSPVVLEK